MKITRSIVIEDETWEKVSQIAEANYTSNAAIIRQAIQEKIERESKKEEQ